MKFKYLCCALSFSALLVSCNPDKQVSIAEAKNYIKEHAKYKESTSVPAAKQQQLNGILVKLRNQLLSIILVLLLIII